MARSVLGYNDFVVFVFFLEIYQVFLNTVGEKIGLISKHHTESRSLRNPADFEWFL